MIPRSALVLAVLLFAALALPAMPRVLAQSPAAQTPAPPLHPGDILPSVSGQTPAGKPLQLPAAGKVVLVVFAFSHAAGKDAKLWNERLAADFSSTVPGYDVVELESVPKLVRGMALSGIRGSMTPARQDLTLILYQDERLWKQRLAVSDDTRAYALLLGPDAHILWRNTAAFTDREYAQLRLAAKTLPEPPR
jgi:hypothetical protein